MKADFPSDLELPRYGRDFGVTILDRAVKLINRMLSPTVVIQEEIFGDTVDGRVRSSFRRTIHSAVT